MTIDEAIKLLYDPIGWAVDDKSGRYEEAVKLGIEALKRVQSQKIFGGADLPGETEK